MAAGAGQDRRLGHPPRPERALRRRHLQPVRLDRREHRRPRQGVVHERAGEQLARLVVDQRLDQRAADPLDRAAGHLPLDERRVERPARRPGRRRSASSETSPVSGSTRTCARWAVAVGASCVCAVAPWPSTGGCGDAQVVASSRASDATVRPSDGRVPRPDDPIDDLEVAGSISRSSAAIASSRSRASSAAARTAGPTAYVIALALVVGVGGALSVDGDHDAHRLERDAERLGGDRAEDRQAPGEVDDAGHDREGAVGLEPARRRRRLHRVAPHAGRERRRPRRAGARRGPATGGDARTASRHSARPCRGHVTAVDHRVALGGEVVETQLDRVDAESPGELVEQGLEREQPLRPGRRAVVAGAEPVRPHPDRPDVDRRPAVRARDQARREPLPRGVRVGARRRRPCRRRGRRGARSGPPRSAAAS